MGVLDDRPHERPDVELPHRAQPRQVGGIEPPAIDVEPLGDLGQAHPQVPAGPPGQLRHQPDSAAVAGVGDIELIAEVDAQPEVEVAGRPDLSPEAAEDLVELLPVETAFSPSPLEPQHRLARTLDVDPPLPLVFEQLA